MTNATSQAAARGTAGADIVVGPGDSGSVYPFKRSLSVWVAVVSMGLLLRASLAMASMPVLAVADIAAIGLIWRLYGLVQSDRLAVRWVEPAAFSVALCALAGTAIRMQVTGSPLEVIPVVGLLLCAPAIFVTPTWFLALAGALVSSWLASAFSTLPLAQLVTSVG